MNPSFAHVDCGEVRLHVARQGQGPKVLLLHGFPEFWFSWREQMRALADAGFEAIAPDLRGYHLSDKPEGSASYALPHLRRDLAGLLDAVGAEKLPVIGHDWGGVLAFSFAAHHPSRVSRLSVLNAPHPRRMLRAIASPAQLRRSWYVFLFQLPGLPERFLSGRDSLTRLFKAASKRREAFGEDVLARYRGAMDQPGAATATLNWYRAALRRPRDLWETPPIHAPTQLLWGEQDEALGTELLDGLEKELTSFHIERFPAAGHFLHHDAPEAVNASLLRFLREG